MQALDDFSRLPDRETSKNDFLHDAIDMSPGSSLHQVIRRLITSEVQRVTKKKFKIEHILAAVEALIDMLAANHAVASNSLKDASYSCIKNILTEMALKGSLGDLYIRNLERWSQVPEFLTPSHKGSINREPLQTHLPHSSSNKWTVRPMR